MIAGFDGHNYGPMIRLATINGCRVVESPYPDADLWWGIELLIDGRWILIEAVRADGQGSAPGTTRQDAVNAMAWWLGRCT